VLRRRKLLSRERYYSGAWGWSEIIELAFRALSVDNNAYVEIDDSNRHRRDEIQTSDDEDDDDENDEDGRDDIRMSLQHQNVRRMSSTNRQTQKRTSQKTTSAIRT
jgi:hypothetical protein